MISLQGIYLLARLLRQGVQRCFLSHPRAAYGLFFPDYYDKYEKCTTNQCFLRGEEGILAYLAVKDH